jgi:hypothetical protein
MELNCEKNYLFLALKYKQPNCKAVALVPVIVSSALHTIYTYAGCVRSYAITSGGYSLSLSGWKRLCQYGYIMWLFPV